MKIISLKFMNLNSLKGVQEVDFAAPPFIETGLFAITGPTGAGKTTILDAITVALYGKVPRLNADNKNTQPVDIFSRHEIEAYSEVVFEVNRKQYRSKWSIRRAYKKLSGDIQDPQMELVDLENDKILESSKRGVPNRVTEITGLDYDRFLRSVMLSQGEFAAFLKAKDSERGELLEKITGTEIYSEISRHAHDKEKEERQRLHELERQVDSNKLLSESALEVIQEQLVALGHEKQQIEREINELQHSLQWLDKINQLESRVTLLHQQLLELQKEKESSAQDLQRVELHEKTVALQGDLAKLQVLSQQLKDTAREIDKLEAEKVKLLKEKEKVSQQHQQTEQSYQQEITLLHENRPIFAEIRKLDQKIASVSQEKASCEQQARKHESDLQLITARYKETSGKKAQLQQQQQELATWLDDNAFLKQLEEDLPKLKQVQLTLNDAAAELQRRMQKQEQFKQEASSLQQTINAGRQKVMQAQQEWSKLNLEFRAKEEELERTLNSKDVEDWESSAENYDKIVRLSTEQLRLSTEHIARAERANLTKEAVEKAKQLLQARAQRIPQLENDLATAIDKLADLEKIWELEVKLKDFEEERKKLISGEPCPLCGSKEHPLAGDHESRPAESLERKKTQQVLVQQMQNELVRTQAEQQSAARELQTQQNQLLEREEELKQLLQQFEKNNSLLQAKWQITATQEIEKYHQDMQQQHNNCKKALAGIRTLLDVTIKLREELFRRTAKINEDSSEVKATETRLQGVQNNITTVAAETADQEKIVAAKKEELASIIRHYSTALANIPQQDVVKTLENQKTAFSKNTELLQNIISQLQVTETEISNWIEQGREKREEYNSAKNALLKQQGLLDELLADRKAKFDDKDVDAEENRLQQSIDKSQKTLNEAKDLLFKAQQELSNKDSLIKSRKESLIELNSHIAFQEKQLLEKANHKGFETLEALQAAILPESELLLLRSRKEKIEKSLIETRRGLSDAQAELETERTKQLTEANALTLKQELEQKAQQRSQLDQQTGQFTLQLKQDAALKEQYKLITEQIEKQQKEWLRWKRLDDLIGSGDGKKFSTFAQGLTLARLVNIANKHLTKLNERYTIRKSSKNDLELEIVDTYQADEVRPMKTLSGGESFLVSLALALGLSELAGRKTRIDSLFIDEGFGTLDSDTLDLAIATLENLQSQAKLIGIISHVEALKERITTQIQVKKLNNGISRLVVVG
jgi:exonuclease SbcC